MMKNYVTKILILILILIAFFLSTSSYAVSIDPQKYKPDELSTDELGKFDNFSATIAGALKTLGIVVAVGGILVIGIKYILGSVEEKAQYKQTLFPFFIGVVLLGMVFSLVGILLKFAQGL